jgi:hypothetical protein
MKARFCRIAGLLLIAGVAAAEAAPNIPPGELPGRERQRFAPSPLDRFTDPLAAQRRAALALVRGAADAAVEEKVKAQQGLLKDHGIATALMPPVSSA